MPAAPYPDARAGEVANLEHVRLVAGSARHHMNLSELAVVEPGGDVGLVEIEDLRRSDGQAPALSPGRVHPRPPS